MTVIELFKCPILFNIPSLLYVCVPKSPLIIKVVKRRSFPGEYQSGSTESFSLPVNFVQFCLRLSCHFTWIPQALLPHYTDVLFSVALLTQSDMEWKVSGILTVEVLCWYFGIFCDLFSCVCLLFVVMQLHVGVRKHTSATCGVNLELIEPDLDKGLLDILMLFFKLKVNLCTF